MAKADAATSTEKVAETDISQEDVERSNKAISNFQQNFNKFAEQIVVFLYMYIVLLYFILLFYLTYF